MINIFLKDMDSLLKKIKKKAYTTNKLLNDNCL